MVKNPRTTSTKEAPPTDVAERKSDPSSFMTTDDSHLKKYGHQGTEDIGREDMEIPRLKLIQGLSPELQADDSLRTGYFYHTAHAEGRKPPLHVAVIFWTKRYVLWNPLDSGGGILARADDAVHWQPSNVEFTVKLDKKDGGATVKWKTANTVMESGLDRWGTMNPNDEKSPPAATLTFDFLLGFPGTDWVPAILSFQRSSVGMGRRWLTKIKTIRRPIFGTVWELSSFVDTNSQGKDFQNSQVVAKAALIGPHLTEYEELNAALREKGLVVRPEQEREMHDEPGTAGRPAY